MESVGYRPLNDNMSVPTTPYHEGPIECCLTGITDCLFPCTAFCCCPHKFFCCGATQWGGPMSYKLKDPYWQSLKFKLCHRMQSWLIRHPCTEV